jgi:hypothetical protein
VLTVEGVGQGLPHLDLASSAPLLFGDLVLNRTYGLLATSDCTVEVRVTEQARDVRRRDAVIDQVSGRGAGLQLLERDLRVGVGHRDDDLVDVGLADGVRALVPLRVADVGDLLGRLVGLDLVGAVRDRVLREPGCWPARSPSISTGRGENAGRASWLRKYVAGCVSLKTTVCGLLGSTETPDSSVPVRYFSTSAAVAGLEPSFAYGAWKSRRRRRPPCAARG